MQISKVKKVFIEVEGQTADAFHNISGLCTTARLFSEVEEDNFKALDGTTRVSGDDPEFKLRIAGADDDARTFAEAWKSLESTLRKFKIRNDPDTDPNDTDNIQYEGSVMVQGVEYVGGTRSSRREFDLTLTVDGSLTEVTAPPAP